MVVGTYAEATGTPPGAVVAAALRLGLTTMQTCQATMTTLAEVGRSARPTAPGPGETVN